MQAGRMRGSWSDARTVLMHADNRRVDHLHGGVMSAGECAHDLGPNARSSPANEAIVASGVRIKVVRHVAPGCPDRRTKKMPLSTRGSFTNGTPSGMFDRNGLMATHS